MAERAELKATLAAARRDEFAGDAEVNAMYAKHGLYTLAVSGQRAYTFRCSMAKP